MSLTETEFHVWLQKEVEQSKWEQNHFLLQYLPSLYEQINKCLHEYYSKKHPNFNNNDFNL